MMVPTDLFRGVEREPLVFEMALSLIPSNSECLQAEGFQAASLQLSLQNTHREGTGSVPLPEAFVVSTQYPTDGIY